MIEGVVWSSDGDLAVVKMLFSLVIMILIRENNVFIL